MVFVALMLVPRSFCEFVIVGQLNWFLGQRSTHLQAIYRARDATYGLFSLILVFFILWALPKKGVEDPFLEKEKIAMQEVSDWVIAKLSAVTEDGKKTAPKIDELFDSLKKDLKRTLKQDDTQVDSRLIKMKLREVKSLRKIYSGWQPIYKWQGEDYNSAKQRSNKKGKDEQKRSHDGVARKFLAQMSRLGRSHEYI